MGRAALDLSAEELASAARVGRNTIARIEGGSTVRKRTADRVKRALVDAGVRFGGSEARAVTVSVVLTDQNRSPSAEAA